MHSAVDSVVRKVMLFNNVILDITFSCRSLVVKMTSAQVVETSITTTDNSPSQDCTHPHDQTTLSHSLKRTTGLS